MDGAARQSHVLALTCLPRVTAWQRGWTLLGERLEPALGAVVADVGEQLVALVLSQGARGVLRGPGDDAAGGLGGEDGEDLLVGDVGDVDEADVFGGEVLVFLVLGDPLAWVGRGRLHQAEAWLG